MGRKGGCWMTKRPHKEIPQEVDGDRWVEKGRERERKKWKGRE